MAARVLVLQVNILLGAYMSVVCCQVEVSVMGQSFIQSVLMSVVYLSVTEEPLKAGLGSLGLSSLRGGGLGLNITITIKVFIREC
jgi:hypothetical protein